MQVFIDWILPLLSLFLPTTWNREVGLCPQFFQQAFQGYKVPLDGLWTTRLPQPSFLASPQLIAVMDKDLLKRVCLAYWLFSSPPSPLSFAFSSQKCLGRKRLELPLTSECFKNLDFMRNLMQNIRWICKRFLLQRQNVWVNNRYDTLHRWRWFYSSAMPQQSSGLEHVTFLGNEVGNYGESSSGNKQKKKYIKVSRS